MAANRATDIGIDRVDRAMGLAFCTGAFHMKHWWIHKQMAVNELRRPQLEALKDWSYEKD